MSVTPNSREWWQIALVLMAAYSAVITTYQAVSGVDQRQDLRLARIESLLCTTTDAERRHTCDLLNIKP